MNKKWFVIIGGTVLSIGLLAGCSGEGEGLAPEDTGGQPMDAPTTTAPVAPSMPAAPDSTEQDETGAMGDEGAADPAEEAEAGTDAGEAEAETAAPDDATSGTLPASPDSEASPESLGN